MTDGLSTSALANLLGGGVVAGVVLFAQGWASRQRSKRQILDLHKALQGELIRHAHRTQEAIPMDPELLAELPYFDTTALRLIPLLGVLDLRDDSNRVVRLFDYVDRIDRVNRRIETLHSFYVGTGAVLLFEDPATDPRIRLCSQIKIDMAALGTEAMKLASEFPTQ